MLLNLSHHSHTTWPERQRQIATQRFGAIEDMPFPLIPPDWKTADVIAKADEMVTDILGKYGAQDLTVHVMGEMTLIVSLILRLQRRHVPCVASTTERIVEQVSLTERKVIFEFVKFREYERIQ